MSDEDDPKTITYQLTLLSNIMDQPGALQPSPKVQAFFAHLVDTNLRNFTHGQLLSLPILIKKLELDKIPTGS